MDRKAIARQTLDIMEKGWYETEGTVVEIRARQQESVKKSVLFTPEQGERLLEQYETVTKKTAKYKCCTWNCSTVDAILKLAGENQCRCAVLNFASAKNPGGGFINGAMAQEESLAASSCLYKTLTAHETYYRMNRACSTMIYTDHAIFSPEASVLTLPAVNMGQVILKGEDRALAEQSMKRRMKLALAIFASRGCRNLILGAYGCGVFRNDPVKVAGWWKELLEQYFPGDFDTIVYAVLDRSATQACLRAFRDI